MKTLNLLLAIFVLALLFFTSCATLFAPQKHPISTSSEPGGANVYVNGFKMGVTPLELKLAADKSYTIEFRKEGYETVKQVINTKIGMGYVLLDILGGLIPIIVDASTGAWYKFDQDTVNAVLVEQNK